MADTFSNDLRLRLQESGSNAGTWGDLLNGTITNIASALGQGSEVIPNASTHTITLADGIADEARSLYLKCTGGGQACTVTLGPNTISKVWIIDNETAHTLTFKQGNNSSQLGTEVAIGAGAVKMIVTNGAGVNSSVTDALFGLEGSMSTLAVTGAATMGGLTSTTNASTTQLTVNGTGAIESGINFANGGTTYGQIYFNNVSPYDMSVLQQYSTGSLIFGTNDTERMRITGSAILIGTSSAISGAGGSGGQLFVKQAASSNGISSVANSNDHYVRMLHTGTIGKIETTYGSGSYTPLTFFTGGGERMRITADGAVVINNAGGDAQIYLGGSSGTNRMYLARSGAETLLWNASNGAMRFGTNNTERLRLDASGNLLVGTTTTPPSPGMAVGSTSSGKNILVFSSSNGSNGIIAVYSSNNTQQGQIYAGSGDLNIFGTSVVKIIAASGGVKLTTNATSWVANSDERAKDIIEPISNAVQKVSTLRSVIGKYKTDSEGTRRSFLIAQDVQAVLPEAVDATDEDNLGVRYTETIPLLVAAIKEQQATIEALTQRIETLENN